MKATKRASFRSLLPILLLLGCSPWILVQASEWPDMLSPIYYHAAVTDAIRQVIDQFVLACQSDPFHHPLANEAGRIPVFTVPTMGVFGAKKGSDVAAQHHAAVDLHVEKRATMVDIYAAHDGVVAAFRDAAKYRHYLSITKTIVNADGIAIGKLVTLYAHIDLDLDEAGGLILDGQIVQAGDLISQHLYSGTVGGPHLHFEIRYYRPADAGTEEFYGFAGPRSDASLTAASVGPWPYGLWNPEMGYGFGNPRNHGLILY